MVSIHRVPPLLEAAFEQREALVEFGRLLLASPFGTDPAKARGLMAIAPASKGPFRPDRDALQRLIEATDGVLADFEAPGGALWLPPTASTLWLTALSARALRRAALRLPMARVLHAGNEIRIERTPSSAEPLRVEARVSGLDVKPHRTIVHQSAVHRDETGSTLFTVDTTLFFPGAARTSDGEDGEQRKRKPPVRVPHGAREIARFTIGIEDNRTYAAISGDFNPVHLSHTVARAFGFRAAFAHGYAVKARLAHRLIHTLLEGDPRRLRRLSVRFRQPVYVGVGTGIYVVRGPAPGREGTHAELMVGPGPGQRANVSAEAVWI